jgi:hypothetical protein
VLVYLDECRAFPCCTGLQHGPHATVCPVAASANGFHERVPLEMDAAPVCGATCLTSPHLPVLRGVGERVATHRQRRWRRCRTDASAIFSSAPGQLKNRDVERPFQAPT